MTTLSVSKTWGAEVLTPDDLNGNFSDIVTWANGNISDANLSSSDPIDTAKIDDYMSATGSEEDVQTDPYPGGSISRATTLKGELERLRYVIAEGLGITKWYQIIGPVGAQTGDVKFSIVQTAPAGWILADDGTIGNASSGGTTRANADTSALFTLIWDNFDNTQCVIQTSAGTPTTRGASAAADFAANKRLSLPKLLGRVIGAAGNPRADNTDDNAAELTTRSFAADQGEEDHTLTASEMPAHAHDIEGEADSVTTPTAGIAGSRASTSSTTVTDAAASEGGGGAHNNMQPTIWLSLLIKL